MSPIFRHRDEQQPLGAEQPEAITEFEQPAPEIPAADEVAIEYPIGSREYFLRSPEVDHMVRYSAMKGGILAKMRGTTIETINRKLEHANMDRRTKRAMINSGLAVRAAGAAQALAQLMSEPGAYTPGSVQDRFRLSTEALAPYRGRIKTIISEDVIYYDIYQAAVNLESDLEVYKIRSETLSSRLMNDLSDNSSARYALAGLAAETSFGDGDNAADEDKLAKQWLMKLLSSPYNGDGQLLKTIMRETQSGGFDSFLALQMLHGPLSEKSAVRNMLLLAGACSGDAETDRTAAERLAVSTEIWPKEAQALLKDAQEQLANRMQQAADGARVDLAAKLGLVSDGMSSLERFDKTMEKMIEGVWGVTRASLTHAPAEVRKKVLAPATSALKSTVTPKFRPTPEVSREITNTLSFVDRQGNVFESGSDEYRKMVESALEKYKGTRDFPLDIEAALEYISHIDFRKPAGRVGLDRINSGDWKVLAEDGSVKPRPLYRFKVQAAVGIPVKTNVMKDHRILFTLIDNDTVGIVGIVPRRDMPDFLKRAGINTAAR